MTSVVEGSIVETVSELEDSYRRLLTIGNKLSRSLDKNAVGVLCVDGAPSADSLSALKSSFTHFMYEQGQDPKTTIKYPGAIGCSKKSIGLARKLNEEKTQFAGLFEKLAAFNVSKRKSFYKTKVSEAFSNSRQPLRFTELSRLCQKQTVRLVPIAETYPQAITWHWMAKPESITTTPKTEIIKQLMQLDGARSSDRIQAQINEIQALPNSELKKSQVKKNPTLRVTYQWGNGVDQRSIRQASMPILFEWNSNRELPDFRFHKPEAPIRKAPIQEPMRSAVGPLKL